MPFSLEPMEYRRPACQNCKENECQLGYFCISPNLFQVQKHVCSVCKLVCLQIIQRIGGWKSHPGVSPGSERCLKQNRRACVRQCVRLRRFRAALWQELPNRAVAPACCPSRTALLGPSHCLTI